MGGCTSGVDSSFIIAQDLNPTGGFNELVFEDVDLARRQVARREPADDGPAHPCRLAGVFRVRWRASLRGRDAGHRCTLPAGQRLGHPDGIEAHHADRRDRVAGARRHAPLRRQDRALREADVLGRSRRAGHHRARSRFHPLLPVPLRGGDAGGDGFFAWCFTLSAANPGDHADGCQDRRALLG